MTPKEHFEFLIRTVIERILRLLGVAVTDRRFRITAHTVAYCWLLASGTLGNWYTVLFYGHPHNMHGLCVISLAHQGICKLYSILRNARFFSQKVDFLQRVYAQSEVRNAQILRTWLRNTHRVVILYIAIILVSSSAFLYTPAYSLLWLHKNEYPIPIFMPGIDPQSATGIPIMWSYQLILLAGTCVGLLGADMLMVVLLLHTCPMSDLLCQKLAAMGDELQREQRWWRPRSDRRTREFLHNCIRMHQEFVRYVGDLAATYYLMLTVEVVTNFLSLSFVLYVMMVLVWTPLYGLAITFVMKTFYVCVLGMLVEIYTDNVLDAFVAFPIYVLTPADQRKLILCTMRAQSGGVLMAGTTPLNMALFVSFLKNTYTVVILLAEMTIEGN